MIELELKTRCLDLHSNYPIIVLNDEDARELGVHASDRVIVKYNGREDVVIVETTSRLVSRGEAGLSRDLLECGFSPDTVVKIRPTTRPSSIDIIKKKLRGEELSEEECYQIIDDITRDVLNDIEMGAYVAAVTAHDYSMRELAAITKRMVETGYRFEWDDDIVADKHSIGGVPGNRVTPIVVPVIASLGIKMPKTSSRAITSPAGTADTLKVWTRVDFSAEEIKEIVNDVGACMVWGGAVDVAPADDKIIRAEYPLSIDPEGQLIASVMAKKSAIGAKFLVVDIPFGPGTKVETLEKAERLARKFKELGSLLGIETRCTITRGEQPIGFGVGPVLEAMDIMSVLKGGGPDDLREKALDICGVLLSMMERGDRETARVALDSGRALEKFREIIKRQGGDPDKNLEEMLGSHRLLFRAVRAGRVTRIDNRAIGMIARTAGSPVDKGAGVKIYRKVGDLVKEGDLLFEVYAEKEFKMVAARELAKKLEPVEIESERRILVEEV